MPKIIAITDSWCNDTIYDAELHILDYITFCKDRESRIGDGVLLYIHIRLPAKPVHSLNNLNIEDSVWCLVTMNNTDKVLVGVVYRTPSSSPDNDCRMLTALNDLQHYQPHSHFLLLGDFNLPNIDWVNNTVTGGNSTFS